MLHVKNILVPVDFSEQTLPMIKYAQTIASRENASIHLIYVNEMVQMAYSGVRNSRPMASNSSSAVTPRPTESRARCPFPA